jgi:hypothetical protein
MVKQLQPARVSALPATPDPAARPGPSRISAEATLPGLLLLIVVVLLIPGTFNLAGSVLAPYRLLLLALFPFLVRRWIADTGGHPSTVDLLVLASCLWLGLSLTVNHGLSTIPRTTIAFVELFGGYLVGRTLIRNRIDHKNYFRYLTLAFLFLMPLAVLEMLTGFNTLRTIADLVINVPRRQGNLGIRLGLIRAQGPLEHPILFGMVASMGVANVFYIYRKSLGGAARAMFFAFMTFTSLSTGPLLSVLCQLCLMAWDRALAFLRFRWLLLAYLALLGLLAIRIGAEFEIREFIVSHLSYSQGSADHRLIVFDYGMMEVGRHPVFGIGLNDWVRPWWRAKEATFDNFWLGYAMRFGLPTFGFLALAWGLSFARIAMQKTLSPEETDYRRGYLITLTGLTIVLGTVHIWNATAVFVMIYLGAGGWFYLQPQAADTRDVEVRSRRAAQARAFGVGPPVPVPAPGGRALRDMSLQSGRVPT